MSVRVSLRGMLRLIRDDSLRSPQCRFYRGTAHIIKVIFPLDNQTFQKIIIIGEFGELQRNINMSIKSCNSFIYLYV